VIHYDLEVFPVCASFDISIIKFFRNVKMLQYVFIEKNESKLNMKVVQ
jgi:hypothetical protein